MSKEKIWTISGVWNKSIEQREERPIVSRNRIWASELGKSDIDIYLKMMGEEPSNPFDSRAYRKFEAGNLFEWIIELVLKRCGIYQDSQKWIGNSEFGLDISGKLDFVVGGKPNYETARDDMSALGLPDLFNRATDNILDYFKANYPDGLPTQITEVKSTSSWGIEKVYETKKALAGHDLQTFHYAYNEKLPATVLYISKDDLRLAEIPIDYKDEELLKRYKTKIEGLAHFYNNKKEPPKEPEVLFEEKNQKFSKNFNVEYSPFLTRNYGYKEAGDYYDKWTSVVTSWNRVIGRIKEGKDMTENNEEKIEEMKEHGFDIEEIKSKLTIKITEDEV